MRYFFAILSAFLILAPAEVRSQVIIQDVVEMKNGDVFRGTVIEQVFGKYLQVRFKDGNEKRIKWGEVKALKKEPVASPEIESPIRGDGLSGHPGNEIGPYYPPAPIAPIQEPMRDLAQRPSYGAFRTLIKVGLARSDISTSSNVSTDGDLGIRAGIGFESSFPPNGYVLAYGVEYVMRSIQVGTGSSQANLNLGYMVWPILSQFRFEKVSLGIGSYLGLLLSGKAVQGAETLDVKSNLSSLDFGVRANVLYNFELKSSAFVGLGYDFGVININDRDSVTNHTRSLFIDVGYSF